MTDCPAVEEARVFGASYADYIARTVALRYPPETHATIHLGDLFT